MAEESIRVAALRRSPVKGMRLVACEHVRLTRDGAEGDRRFYVVDQHGRMVNAKRIGALQQVTADLREDGSGDEELVLGFPGGAQVASRVVLGAMLRTTFFSRPREARMLEGALSQTLSEHAGQALRIVAAADGSSAVDRGRAGAVSLISSASLERLAREAGQRQVDARRFRMSIQLDGAGAFAEDEWIGRELSMGTARIAPRGNVGRCIVTSRDPESGTVDLPTLDLLRSLRADAESSEPLPFGVHAAVTEPGEVRVGDRVRVH